MKTAVLFNFDNEIKKEYHESENADYLKKQIIMYSGRKVSMLNFIDDEIVSIKKRLNKNKIQSLDGFSGTGIVSRLLKQHSSKIIANDQEYYSKIISQCYLTNKSSINIKLVIDLVNELNSKSIMEHDKGFIEELYSPKITHNIKAGERPFFTNENAKIIDNIRRDIEIIVPEEMRPLFFAPLLASINGKANVMNVFRAFYKDTLTNIGQWGGNNKNSESKIFKRIFIEAPILSDFDCETEIFCTDINALVKELPEVDIAFFDPPCDQYAYGENYFMYNIIARNERPIDITPGAGVPKNWKRSLYNSINNSATVLTNLISGTKAKYIMLTYNENGLLSVSELKHILEQFGEVTIKRFTRNSYDKVNLYVLEMNK